MSKDIKFISRSRSFQGEEIWISKQTIWPKATFGWTNARLSQNLKRICMSMSTNPESSKDETNTVFLTMYATKLIGMPTNKPFDLLPYLYDTGLQNTSRGCVVLGRWWRSQATATWTHALGVGRKKQYHTLCPAITRAQWNSSMTLWNWWMNGWWRQIQPQRRRRL